MPKTIFDSPQNQAELQKRNPDNFNPNIGNVRYRVDEQIYIFSVARRDFPITQTLFPKLLLKGCEPGQRWCIATIIPDPVPQASPDLERGGSRIDIHDGWRCAIGIVNPENPTPDPWVNAESGSLSVGTNLVRQGLWPSHSSTPDEADIKRAEGLRDRHYRRLTDGAMAAARQSSAKLSDYLREHEDVSDAMDALGLRADWHHTRIVQSVCPNCGDSITGGVAFHQSSAGVLCILDPEKAFKAGAINRERLEDLMTAPAV